MIVSNIKILVRIRKVSLVCLFLSLPMRFNKKDDEFINDIDNCYRCPECNEKIN